VANGPIVVGAGSAFHGVIHGGDSLRLCGGVRGSKEGGLVVAHASGRVLLENNVVVRGKISSGDRVIALVRRPRNGNRPTT
jgi:hypothetical protein